MTTSMASLIGFVNHNPNVVDTLRQTVARLERDCECLRNQLKKERALADARENMLNAMRRAGK